jgi:type I restriction enzyme M protein
MLPLVVLRRLDCVLANTKEEVLSEFGKIKDKGTGIIDAKLSQITDVPFYNTSLYDFQKLKADPDNISSNLVNFMKGFSPKASSIIESFKFESQIEKLEKANRLFLIISRFAEIDLHPDIVSNIEMGYIFEDLIRRFNEASNEEAGDHFTPREVIRLMVDIIFEPDSDILTSKGIVKTIFDPAMGTGGMLSVSEEYLKEHNPDATLEVFGQDYNDQSYAISGSDMLIKGQNIDHIVLGDSFTEDGFKGNKFDYMLANPPFGVEWKPELDAIKKEHDELGYSGRFGAGLPRINDGSFLFLQHMISKMKKPGDGGTRLGIVFNGSPLFTGSAGSGESEIRRWIIENDWLEAIIALPDQLFYNTGISTYIWIVSNRKSEQRKGRVQLIDGSSNFVKMRKSLGNKRNEISDRHREELVRLYADFQEGEHCKIFDNADFGYSRITVERPLKLNFEVNEERLERVRNAKPFQALAQSKKRKNKTVIDAEVEKGKREQEQIISALKEIDGKFVSQDEFLKVFNGVLKKNGIKLSVPLKKAIISALSERDEEAEIVTNKKGDPEPDSELRNYEHVPLKENIKEYVEREVLPYVPDAWVDESKTKIGYEISFNRYFYVYQPPRAIEEIQDDLSKIENEIELLLRKGDKL